MISLVLLLVFLIFSFSYFLSKKNLKSLECSSPFECGLQVVLMIFYPFSLRFFFLSILFLIFDIELILIFPYLMNLANLYSFVSISFFFIFLVVLLVGLFFEWNKMLLDWNI